MRPLRLLLGLLCVLGAGWILVAEQMAGASANAVINAPLTTLRTPVAGTVALARTTLGARVAPGEEVGRITDPLADTVRLHDLRLERDQTAADLAAVEAQISAFTAVQAGTRASTLPNTDTRLDWAMEGPRLDAEQHRLMAHLDALDKRISAAQVSTTAHSAGALTSPVDGIVWDILQAEGVAVQRGDPIVRLANCTQGLVTLSVTERLYNRLSVGQPATFRADGDSTLHPATIARLAGSGAATLYTHMAVAPTARHLDRYDVLLLVPSLGQDQSQGCRIGRTGRAFFESRPLDGLRAWWKG